MNLYGGYMNASDYRAYREEKEYKRLQSTTKETKTKSVSQIRDKDLHIVMQKGETLKQFEIRRRLKMWRNNAKYLEKLIQEQKELKYKSVGVATYNIKVCSNSKKDVSDIIARSEEIQEKALQCLCKQADYITFIWGLGLSFPASEYFIKNFARCEQSSRWNYKHINELMELLESKGLTLPM